MMYIFVSFLYYRTCRICLPDSVSHDMNRCRPFGENLKLRNTLVNQHVQAIDNKPALG